jgi:hypothetical protein
MEKQRRVFLAFEISSRIFPPRKLRYKNVNNLLEVKDDEKTINLNIDNGPVVCIYPFGLGFSGVYSGVGLQ